MKIRYKVTYREVLVQAGRKATCKEYFTAATRDEAVANAVLNCPSGYLLLKVEEA